MTFLLNPLSFGRGGEAMNSHMKYMLALERSCAVELLVVDHVHGPAARRLQRLEYLTTRRWERALLTKVAEESEVWCGLGDPEAWRRWREKPIRKEGRWPLGIVDVAYQAGLGRNGYGRREEREGRKR